MYSVFENLHACSKCRHNYSVSCQSFSAQAPPLLYPIRRKSIQVFCSFQIKFAKYESMAYMRSLRNGLVVLVMYY